MSYEHPMKQPPAYAKAQEFCAAFGIRLLAAGQPLPAGRRGSFESDPARDFGGLYERQPGLVFCPQTLEQAQAVLRFLYSESIDYKLRGAAHSPSGEVLSEGGAVVDVSGLRQSARSTPGDGVHVSGGTPWGELCDQLLVIGRAPRVLTDNPYSTVAGTLSVGGFGDSSHRFGLQIDSVHAATLLLPTGDLCRVERQDELLQYALAGHGQLGLLADVRLSLWPRSARLHACLLHFESTAAFVAASIQIIEQGRLDFVRARALETPPYAVTALVGRYGHALSPETLAGLPYVAGSAPEWLDLRAQQRKHGRPKWPAFNPALEVVLPLPQGLSLLEELNETARSLGPSRLPRGYSLLVLRGRQTGSPPLAPLPSTPFALVVALRPECSTRSEAEAAQSQLKPWAHRVVGAGGAIYLCSFPLPPDLVTAQYSSALSALRSLKQRVDPKGLCNRHSLFGFDCTSTP